jgi:hypothetical protein
MQQDLQARLWAVAAQQAAEHDLPFAAGGELHLQMAIREAAERIVTEGADRDPKQIEAAEAATKRFVDSMVEVAHDLGYTEFHEASFFGAFDRLCPGLWPFC